MKSPKPATVVDVAKEAGVGTTTVSRVLNGQRYVQSETVARVQTAVKKLGYVPSHAARSLKGERSHTIGLIVPSIRDDFFSAISHEIQLAAKDRGYVLLVLTSADDTRQAIDNIDVLRSHRAEGVILTPPRVQSPSFLKAVRTLGVPTISIDRPVSDRVPFVGTNNKEAAFQATQHLLALGRERIFFVGGSPLLYTIRERQAGFEAAMRQRKLKADAFCDPCPEAMAEALLRCLSNRVPDRPNAVLGGLNIATIAAFRVLKQLRLRIPQDVALLGFDDFATAEYLQPPLSVVKQPVEAMAQAAVETLFRMLRGESVGKSVIVPSELLERQSCS